MNVRSLLLPTLLSIGIASASAAVIIQDPGQDYVKFQAGSYLTLTNPSGPVLTDNGNGTLTTTSGATTYSSAGTVTYQITFAEAGNYVLYFQASYPNLSSDSLFLPTSLDTTPIASSSTQTNRWNNLNDGAAGTNKWTAFYPTSGTGVMTTTPTTAEYGPGPGFANGTAFSVTAGTHTFVLSAREANLTWENFVFSKVTDLTSSQLNSLEYSAVPEPAALALLAGGMSALAFRRRIRTV